MRATQDVLDIWKLFDAFPMETLSKAWIASVSNGGRQRTVEVMEEHRQQYGLSGNCFDLAAWLIHKYKAEGMEAYGVGNGLCTPKAHVAVVAVNHQGYRYFCDLGDQWIEPVLIDPDSEDFCQAELTGFVTGGKVKVEATSPGVRFSYIRPNGKVSYQSFDLTPIGRDEWMAAACYSQSLLRHPLVEMRLPASREVIHWEFDSWNSFISSSEGLTKEPQLDTNEEWAAKIHERTGMSPEIVLKALDLYSSLRK